MSNVPTPENLAQAFQNLKTAAAQLNVVSDQLAEPILALEQTLKRLNLGVSAWVEVHGNTSDSGESYWHIDVGYDKIDSTWGIALRERSGDYDSPEDEHRESWLFANAPRRWRADAIEHLPALLVQLTTAATEATEKLRERIAKAQEVAAAFRDFRPTAADAARALAGKVLAGKAQQK